MPISAKEFLEIVEARRIDLPCVQRCVKCGTALQETVTGNREIAGGHVCSDCYFNLWGEELDKFPIGMPKSSRGA